MMPNNVYGSLMHHAAELQAMGEAAHQPPYHAPPVAPVLYIKPANTFNAFGGTLVLPPAQTGIVARACVGLIHKPHSKPLRQSDAQHSARGLRLIDWQSALLCDFTLHQDSFYRPPLRFNALNGSLALPQAWKDEPLDDLHHANIETWINGQLAHSYHAADWLVSAQDQLAAVSEFIAWEEGDVLMLGCPPNAPHAAAGDVVETRMNGQSFTRTTIQAANIQTANIQAHKVP